MRAVGVDVGTRRIGLAVSDATGTLARPLTAVAVASLDRVAVARVAEAVGALQREDDGVSVLVVGVPRRLDGTPTAFTAGAERFARALAAACGLPLVEQDEWLSSVEADERLAVGVRSWRERKRRLDAAAAAIILQDYLDRASTSTSAAVVDR